MYKPVSDSEATPKNNTSIRMESAYRNEQPIFGSEFPNSQDANVPKDDYVEHPSMQEEAMRSNIIQTNFETEDLGYYKPSYSPPENNNEDLPRNSSRSKGSLANSTILSHSNVERNEELLRPTFHNNNLPSMLYKKGEELRQNNSADYLDLREVPSVSRLRNEDPFEANTLLDESGRKKGNEDFKASTLVKRGLLSKQVTISLPFDEFVDRVKGREPATLASNYPSYKIDKRLIFLGKEVDYPWHIISYHSNFRKLWNLIIIALITYEIFWYPLAAAFLEKDSWPVGSLVFEILSICIFVIDMIVNIRTTYSNENNEEIIDGKMMKNNYIKGKLFLVDVITTLPIPEITLGIASHSENRWLIYSLVMLVRMLRVFKIPVYLENRTLGFLSKLLKLFVTFFLIIHWVSCFWFVILKAEYPDLPTVSNLWFPNNLRMIAATDSDLMDYYTHMPMTRIYGFTLLSVFMLAIGSDMAPVTNLQIWISVLIGLFGAVGLAYIFAMVTLIINRAYHESSAYQEQLEELKHKLKINKIPHNLRVKVMEYFYYSWRKTSVLKKMDDFSELSIPLQRDIALYQHQEMIIKVPLFKDLDPVEILSIVQKLRTAIYMPGDKIVREGEKGTEMFFIQEGVAEKIIRRQVLRSSKEETKLRPEKLILEKGNYFGEVSLISNSKRTFDVNAFEFCILYTFSKTDYDSLRNEFKDIGPRLRSGLKHYKNTHMGSLIQILGNLDIFQGFTERELQRIGDEYLEELFVDPDNVILAPKNRTNAIYIILGGNINCYADDDETRIYLKHLKRSNDKDNWTVVDIDEDEDIDCLDDDILQLEKDKLSMEDDKNRLDLIKTYTYGEYFGTLDFDVNEIKCKNFYVTDSGCQIGAMTQSLKSQMAEEDPILYQKLHANVIKCCPKRIDMGPIEEESDSSFTTRNNTVLKTRLSKRLPSFTEAGKKPVLIKVSSMNQNRDDDLVLVKDELQQLEEEMANFKGLVGTINNKLNRINVNLQPIPQSDENSPEILPKPTMPKALLQAFDNARKNEQLPNRELAKALLGVDEMNMSAEAQSMREEK